MREASPKNQGDRVAVGESVGYEGTTGSSTGIHLHLEMQNLLTKDWEFGADLSVYINPALFMGISNTEGISVIYKGTPGPGPTPSFKRGNFKWVLYANKLRNKRRLF